MNKDIQNENYDLNFSEFYELYLKEIGLKSGLFLVLFPIKWRLFTKKFLKISSHKCFDWYFLLLLSYH